MNCKTAKFGGSSLSEAAQFKKVKQIVMADSSIRYVVPSAPGKRFSSDDKVTDLLYRLHDACANGTDYATAFATIVERFVGIKRELGLQYDIENELDCVLQNLLNGAGRDYAASRGEYLNGLLLAEYLGFEFLDPKDIIFFDERGIYDEEKTARIAAQKLQTNGKKVIPGFYGSKIGRAHV